MKYQEDKWDKYVRWLLAFAALYFLVHIASALAQSYPAPPPTIRCIPSGEGSVTCFPI
jgi:hypothetical protein